jgi:hypothetical protein
MSHDPNPFERVELAIAVVRRGGMVIMVDDEDRENEGDLVIAAQHCDAQAVNFMTKHGRGLICLSLGMQLQGEGSHAAVLKERARPEHRFVLEALNVHLHQVDAVETGGLDDPGQRVRGHLLGRQRVLRVA